MAYTLQMVGQKYAEPAVASIVMSMESVIAVVACVILALWEHGNQKTDTSIYCNIILYSSANIERNCWFQSKFQMI